MVFQYIHDPRATEVERKLDEIRSSNDSSFITDAINSCIVKPVPKRLDQTIQPNKDFLEAHKRNKIKEQEDLKHKQFLDSVDESGYKLEKVYETEEFKKLHDPLHLYASKGNYRDLAFKVYDDVEESNYFFEKTLYYPDIRTEDYNKLVSNFSDEHRSISLKKKTNALFAIGGFGAGYYLGNLLRFKAKSTLLISAVLFGVSWKVLNELNVKGMNRRLGKKAIDVAKKYPDIKFTNIEFRKINV